MRKHVRRALVVGLALVVTSLAVMPSDALARGRHGGGWRGHGGHSGHVWRGHGGHGGHGWRGHSGHVWRGHGWRGPRVFLGVGVPFVYGAYAYPYYQYPAYAPPAAIVESAPSQVYIQRDSPSEPVPAQQYWHYCESSRAYYPYVKECPSGWLQVLPQAPR